MLDDEIDSTAAGAARPDEGHAAPEPESALPSGVPEAIFDDTVFRATQRIPTLVGEKPQAPTRLVEPQATAIDEPGDQLRRTLVPVLLVAALSLGTLIGWQLLQSPSAGLSVASLGPVGPPTAVSTSSGANSAPTPSTLKPSPIPSPTMVSTAISLPPPVRRVPPPGITVTRTITVVAPATTSATPSVTPTTPACAPAPGPSTTSPSVSATALPTSTWLLSTQGLGPVTLGTSAQDAIAAGFLVVAPCPDAGYLTGPSLGSGIRVAVTGEAVSAVVVTDPTIRSQEGVGVGSSVAAVQAAYGSRLTSGTVTDAAGVPHTVWIVDAQTNYLVFQPVGDVVGTVVVGRQESGRIVLPPTPTPTRSPSGTPTV